MPSRFSNGSPRAIRFLCPARIKPFRPMPRLSPTGPDPAMTGCANFRFTWRAKAEARDLARPHLARSSTTRRRGAGGSCCRGSFRRIPPAASFARRLASGKSAFMKSTAGSMANGGYGHRREAADLTCRNGGCAVGTAVLGLLTFREETIAHESPPTHLIPVRSRRHAGRQRLRPCAGVECRPAGGRH